MSKLFVLTNLLVGAYVMAAIVWHMVRPGQDYVYTRVLLANLLVVPVTVFVVLLLVPMIMNSLHSHNTYGLIAGAVLSLLALIIGGGLAYGMLGVRGALWLLACLYPLAASLAAGNFGKAVLSVIGLGLLFWAAFGIGIFLAFLLPKLGVSLAPQVAHFQQIWTDYYGNDAARMFLSVCMFGLFCQLAAFVPALKGLLKH